MRITPSGGAAVRRGTENPGPYMENVGTFGLVPVVA
jgi:hypothetical protein